MIGPRGPVISLVRRIRPTQVPCTIKSDSFYSLFDGRALSPCPIPGGFFDGFDAEIGPRFRLTGGRVLLQVNHICRQVSNQ